MGVSGWVGEREREREKKRTGRGKGETHFFIPVCRPIIIVSRTPQDNATAEGAREDVSCCFVDAGGGALIPFLIVSLHLQTFKSEIVLGKGFESSHTSLPSRTFSQ
jgi:hypothetical protein